MTISRVKTWGSEVLTHTDLNAEFDNIINNLTPDNLGDYSANAGEMRTTVDPYPAGAESLATTLAGEIARLRYIINQMNGRTYWYQDPVTSLSSIPSLLGLSASVNTNSLTITLTDKDGTALSSTNTANIAFRSATLTSGTQVIRTINSGTTFTLSAGSTLGFLDDEIGKIYVWAIDNSGTVELAVSRTADLYLEDELQDTTAEGGVGGADSATTMYSTTSRSNVSCRLIGFLVIQTGSTAGNWSSSPTQIQIISPYMKMDYISNITSSTSPTTDNLISVVKNTHGLVFDSGDIEEAINSITISGLDANTNGGYDFEFILYNPTAADCTYRLYYNGDTTNTNYNWLQLTYSVSNDAKVWTTAPTLGTTILNGHINITPTGYIETNIVGGIRTSAGSLGIMGTSHHTKISSVTNLTQLDIISTPVESGVTKGIGIGSRLRIWQRI